MIIETTNLPGDLSVSTVKVLCHLHECGHDTMVELAKVTNTSTPAITYLIDRAEAIGLVERFSVEGDRRKTGARLTEEGIDLVERFKPQPETSEQ